MCVSKETLAIIIEMQKAMKKELNGNYSVYQFAEHKTIEYAGDISGMIYSRNTKCGDYVTEGVLTENTYYGKRCIVWTERVIDVEEHSPAITKGLPKVLKAGECICLLKDINSGTGPSYWVPSSYVTVPDGHNVMIQHGSPAQVGYAIVVPEFEGAPV